MSFTVLSWRSCRQYSPCSFREYDGVVVDLSRQRATSETMSKLLSLAEVSTWAYTLGFIRFHYSFACATRD